jgi:aspartyl-tRNA(Asn)/glutamyl-tRNA(Gln) amidotransferase subunit A
MPGSDPLRWNAPTIAAAVQAKRADPVEVIDAFLAQIRRANLAVNALVDHGERGLGRTGAEVAGAHAFSLRIASRIARFFASWDLLPCPAIACVAWRADRLDPETVGGRPAVHRDHAAFTPLFNHARTPAISIPCGTGQDGLSVGLQIIGPRLADWRVLAAASFMERALADG